MTLEALSPGTPDLYRQACLGMSKSMLMTSWKVCIILANVTANDVLNSTDLLEGGEVLKIHSSIIPFAE